MTFDYSKLRGRIKEVVGTQSALAQEIGIGKVSLSKRLNNELDFSSSDIISACETLKIEKIDIPIYFFTEKAQKHEQQSL